MQNIENVQKLCNHPHILPGGGGELMWSLEQDSKKNKEDFLSLDYWSFEPDILV